MHIDGGYIVLAKKIQQSDIWTKKPSDWLKIWLYLLMNVNHKDNEPQANLKKGQGYFSYPIEKSQIPDITEHQWHECIRFLKTATQITTQKTTRGIIITICNYETYQTYTNYKNKTETDTENKTETKQNRNRTDTILKEVKEVKEVKEDLKEYMSVLNLLNTTTKKNFKPVPANIKLISARFKEGRTIEDFKQVIELKTSQWLNDPKMNKYLRPETLFNATKFEGYLNESNPPPIYERKLGED